MKALAIGALALGALTLSSAQVTPIAPKQGVFSFDFSFDWFSPNGGNDTTTLRLNPAYFVTNNISIGVPFTWVSSSGSDSTAIGINPRFYFMNAKGNNPPAQFQPFIGGIWQWMHSTGGSNDTFWGGELGANYFVANNVAVTGSFILGRSRIDGVNNDSTEFFAGFTIFFAGK